MRFLYCLLLVLLTGCFAKKDPALFRIVHDNKFGFINANGTTVIEPIYSNASDFFEGLAAVRLGGYFGYIDASGVFVIPPQFEFAQDFNGGYAIVHIDHVPFYIDRTGKKVFENFYAKIYPFDNGTAVVQTHSLKYGVINEKGVLIIDTAYSELIRGAGDTYIVYGLDHYAYKDNQKNRPWKYEAGVIDRTGKFMIPYGIYSSIERSEVGFYGDSASDDVHNITRGDVFLDSTGKYIMGLPHTGKTWLAGPMSEGIAVLNFHKMHGDAFAGLIDIRGNIILKDSNYQSITPFSSGRAFARDQEGDYWLINKKGERVSRESFDELMDEQFHGNVAFVNKDDKWGLIDTNGRFKVRPKFEHISPIGIFSDHFFFSSSFEGDPEARIGVADLNGKILISPTFSEVHRDGYKNGLLKVMENERSGYVDRKGKYIWREAVRTGKADTLDIDYMGHGFFFADTLEVRSPLVRIPEKIAPDKQFASGRFTLEVRTKDTCRWKEYFAGVTLYLVNSSAQPMLIEVQDSRLDLKIQALDKHGNWKDIQYLLNSWCGNSYYNVSLHPGYYYSFAMPLYKGSFKTKLRAELTYLDPIKMEPIKLYSNIFDGSVNLGQFWRQQSYISTNIMDPYGE